MDTILLVLRNIKPRKLSLYFLRLNRKLTKEQQVKTTQELAKLGYDIDIAGMILYLLNLNQFNLASALAGEVTLNLYQFSQLVKQLNVHTFKDLIAFFALL